MCGIGAFQIKNNEVEGAQLARVLLRLLETRGMDASGVAWHEGGQTFVQKSNIAGSELARQFKQPIGSTGIVHTRWATQGSPTNNDNNHPIDVGGLIGVHNGHISNDKQLLQLCSDYKRCAQVDSEAVFALLAHGTDGMTLADKANEVRGNAALLWLDSFDESETLHAMRLVSSPLWLGQTAMGTIVLASTKAILLETAVRCKIAFDYMHEFAEGEYMKIQNSSIVELDNVPVPAPVKPLWSLHDYTAPSKYSKSGYPTTRPSKYMYY